MPNHTFHSTPLKITAIFLLLSIFFLINVSKVNAAPLIQTHWNQGLPYNKNFPLMGGKRPFAGCSVVALAQLVYYYSAPNLITDIPQFLFQVAIDINSSPERKSDGVIEMSTNANYVLRYLQKFFYLSRREYYSVQRDSLGIFFEKKDDWHNMIICEIDHRHPVLYFAYDQFNRGHTFIIDDYQRSSRQKVFFHINWGWGGSGDGYYDLKDLRPFANDNTLWNFNHSLFIHHQCKKRQKKAHQ